MITLLLLCPKRPVLEPQMMAVTFPALCGINVILGAAPEADFKVEPAMLGNLSLEWIGDWHLLFYACRRYYNRASLAFSVMKGNYRLLCPHLFSRLFSITPRCPAGC